MRTLWSIIKQKLCGTTTGIERKARLQNASEIFSEQMKLVEEYRKEGEDPAIAGLVDDSIDDWIQDAETKGKVPHE